MNFNIASTYVRWSAYMQIQCRETQLQRKSLGMPSMGDLDHTLSRKGAEGEALLSAVCHGHTTLRPSCGSTESSLKKQPWHVWKVGWEKKPPSLQDQRDCIRTRGLTRSLGISLCSSNLEMCCLRLSSQFSMPQEHLESLLTSAGLAPLSEGALHPLWMAPKNLYF